MSDATEYRLRLGIALETARVYRKLTQEHVAAEIGAGQGSAIGRWERGENEPGVEFVARLAVVLDIPAEWIVTPPATRAKALVQLGAYDEARGRQS